MCRMDERPRILFYFLHLLGVGHVFRAKRLVEGFTKAGFAVDIIYGGEPLEAVSFDADSVHYLSPIRAADNTYSTYLDATGNRLERPFQDQRAREVVAILDTLNPDIVLTEAYPFGRRIVRYEMAALLDHACRRDPRPLIVSSVRDILQERKKPGREEETCQLITRYFDRVLVHSDPAIITLDATFPLAHRIEDKIAYTGFVVPTRSSQPVENSYDVLVSAGGGAFGGALMAVALDAARRRPDLTWCLSTGPNLPEHHFARLCSQCPDNVTVTQYLADLCGHMKRARISISQCGYNTAMDSLVAHGDSSCRAVFVPYDTEGQSEQLMRAQLLESAGYGICLPQSGLSVEGLLRALDSALVLPQVQHEIDFGGVETTANLLLNWLEE